MTDKNKRQEEQKTLKSDDREQNLDRVKNTRKTLSKFFKDLMKQKWKLLIIAITLAAASVCSVLCPRVLGMAMNQIFDGVRVALKNGTVFSVDFTTMGTILLALIGLYTMGTVFNYIPQRILAGVSQNLVLDPRKRISDKLNKLPLKHYDTHKKGQILSRITNDLERVADSVQETMANMIAASITLIGAFLMMLMISSFLTLIALVTVIVSAVVSVLIGSRTK